ncbi:MAG: hypothetical protein ACRELX_08015 [Longimicrobiales bacterium]
MNPHRTTFRTAPRALLAVLALGVLPAVAPAQSLPSAQQLVDRHVEAIGGREAVLAPQSMLSKGQFSIPTAGLAGDLEIYQAQPNMSFTRVNISGLGEIRTGYNGEIGWTINPMEGPRVMEGMELAALKDEAGTESILRGPKFVESMETVEQTSMNGEVCYKVKVVWKSGRESFDCYAVDSGLLIGMQLRNASPMGVIDVTVLLSDYKEFGDVSMPTRMSQQMMGQEQVFTISSVEFNMVDRGVFELPVEIRALVTK